MNKFRVKVLRNIKSEKTEVGVGAEVMLQYASKPIISILRESCLKDNTCLNGDIDFLFTFDGIGEDENCKYYKS